MGVFFRKMSIQILCPPFFFKNYLFLFIYLWLCWIFVSVRGLSPAAASGGHSSSRCAGLSLSRPLSWRSTGSRRAGSVIVAHGSLVALRNVGSSQTRAWTCVPCIGRQTLNHCATREALSTFWLDCFLLLSCMSFFIFLIVIPYFYLFLLCRRFFVWYSPTCHLFIFAFVAFAFGIISKN